METLLTAMCVGRLFVNVATPPTRILNNTKKRTAKERKRGGRKSPRQTLGCVGTETEVVSEKQRMSR